MEDFVLVIDVDCLEGRIHRTESFETKEEALDMLTVYANAYELATFACMAVYEDTTEGMKLIRCITFNS